ncbi:uncharacterized protein HMPREF1541_03857 [Cyphellophora europaea CBS 101466]|uniref:Uncharacterized protein n=1 Tax=Cyphellophora europaea (strain CBS 101466) TaxID=1220924 RepID=W2S1K9_CYPE1|nr:uncharacterized protein HMPREF1541_03857 [Cyphellophora europaea CBS 101466]ETN41918.1 hypothetical protein HMPREF1541_03857 [Cyphellophora europaea CBS 101466]
MARPNTPRTPERAMLRADVDADALPFAIARDDAISPSPRRSQRSSKPPTVTPRRFKRFFAPRVKFPQDITADARPPLKEVRESELNTRRNNPDERPAKRRRISFIASPLSSSLPSSPVQRVGFLSSSQDNMSDDDGAYDGEDITMSDSDDSSSESDIEEQAPYGRCKPYRQKSLSARLLSMRIDGLPHRQSPVVGNDLWQHETANFYTSPSDSNLDKGETLPYSRVRSIPAIPFCTTSCNTNSLIVVGDEDGYVRFIDSANDQQQKFNKTFLTIKPHDNAIMDMEFSYDDKYLVTASGDQTCQITDVQRQKSIVSLSGHSCSVKKAQFHPGNPNLLVSCARDGDINIWDLRENPCALPPRVARNQITDGITARAPVRTIWDAHRPGKVKAKTRFSTDRNDICITSMSFLDETRPYLFATASDSNTIVKLWDIRSKHTRYNSTVPISQTEEPTSHISHRRFGTTSMALSSDGSKLYTLCRDHTVYAYSTSHLILGSASEMQAGATKWKGEKFGAKSGLGPLYGFRDPSMAIATFYCKLAVRKATETQPELLAVGSSDECAVLYPTDSRYHTKASRTLPTVSADLANQRLGRLRLTRTDHQSATLSLKKRASEDDIPIYYIGSPLAKGHTSEVTGVTWSNEGNLVTISDDHRTRCWREDEARARYYRSEYEGEADRAGAGWAFLRDEDWDDEV